MKNFQNYKVVIGDSTRPKLAYFISQMKSLRTWTTKGIRGSPFRACLHGLGDPGLVGLVSFVFTHWGTQNKETYPTRPESPTPCKQGVTGTSKKK